MFHWIILGPSPIRSPPPCISYALVQATVGVGTILIWYLILIRHQMYCSHEVCGEWPVSLMGSCILQETT